MVNGALTAATETYVHAFSSYIGQFVIWGQWIFGALLVSNMIWLWLWYAIDKESIKEGMAAFIKKFFIVMLFYTVMVNHQWLLSILQTSESMGQTLTGIPMDPTSILANGLMVANKVLKPIAETSLLSAGFSLLFGFVVYLVILTVFISIALELALTLIMATALITVTTFFLGFAALGATSQIARQSLDVLIGICVKLLGIYLVVGTGSLTMSTIAAQIPTTVLSYDDYGWLLASVLLFWLLAKNLPNQMGKIVSGAIHETQGTDAAAIAFAAARVASYVKNPAMKGARVAMKGVGMAATVIGSTGANASAHFNSGGMNSIAARSINAATGAAKDFGKAGWGTISDHFKHLGNKLAGGSGFPGGSSNIPGISQRLYESGQQVKSAAASAPSKTSADQTDSKE